VKRWTTVSGCRPTDPTPLHSHLALASLCAWEWNGERGGSCRQGGGMHTGLRVHNSLTTNDASGGLRHPSDSSTPPHTLALASPTPDLLIGANLLVSYHSLPHSNVAQRPTETVPRPPRNSRRMQTRPDGRAAIRTIPPITRTLECACPHPLRARHARPRRCRTAAIAQNHSQTGGSPWELGNAHRGWLLDSAVRRAPFPHLLVPSLTDYSAPRHWDAAKL
jgi:hypothetical protein